MQFRFTTLRLHLNTPSLRVSRLGCRRTFILSSLPAVLVPPVVFTGLVITLWTYKCAMMVVFQNKIIYMPGVPLGARSETIDTYKSLTQGISWQKQTLKTSDNQTLAFATASVSKSNPQPSSQPPTASNESIPQPLNQPPAKKVLIVYFQGNASSTPPRLPVLSQILTSLVSSRSPTNHKYTLLAPSYRGYWSSTGRPSQPGIEKDSAAIFSYIAAHHPDSEIIIWGQSIGCGVLLQGLSGHISSSASPEKMVKVRGIILETPFLSIEEMLIALYPQKWLPYRYLAPFLRNHWDARSALRRIFGGGRGEVDVGKVLVLQGGRDELVPEYHGVEIEKIVDELSGGKTMGGGKKKVVERVVVRGALHVECMSRPQGRNAVVRFIEKVLE
ncbi:hypothetical protein RUND412_002057 [Rhizina undulata]